MLTDLSRIVAALADSAEQDAALLEDLVEGQTTYESLVRAILTGKAIPASRNPGPGGPLAVPRAVALEGARVLKMSLIDGAEGAGQRGHARADELDAVKNKEQEEKEGSGGGAGSDASDGNGEEGTGGTRPRDQVGESATPSGELEGQEGEGTGASNGSRPAGGTVTSPPDGVPAPGEGTPPAREVPPVVTVKRTSVRRCFELTLRNTTGKPVSDLQFPADGVTLAETPQAPEGWEGGSFSNAAGFGFAVKPGAAAAIEPGRELGPFRFCVNDRPFSVAATLSHPDGTVSPIAPGQVRVAGKSVPFRDGVIHVPAVQRTYVHELEVTTGSGAEAMEIRPATGKVTDWGDDAGTGVGIGPLPVPAGREPAYPGVTLFGTGNRLLPPGQVLRLSVTTTTPTPRFSARLARPT
jgi:hypothetical protein